MMDEFFSYFVNLASILGNFGMLIMGVAAWLGIKGIFDEKKSRRSDAASLILSKVRRCFDEIIDMTEKPAYFHNDAEIEKLNHGHANLVEHKIKQLRFDLHDAAARLSLHESTMLFEILENVKQSCGRACDWNHIANLEEPHHQEAKESCLASYRELFKSLVSDSEKLLVPIIESGDLKTD